MATSITNTSITTDGLGVGTGNPNTTTELVGPVSVSNANGQRNGMHTNTDGQLVFFNNNYGNLTSTLVIDDETGNIGIGTTSPGKPLSVVKAGGGNFVAEFQNTTSGTPYGVHIKDAASGANGYPLLTVTDSPGTGTYFRVDSGTGYVSYPNRPLFDVASNQSVGQNSYQTYNTQYHNVGNHFSLANNRFTAPVNGLYQFFASTIKNTSNSGGVARVYIYVNGSVSNGSRHVRLSEGANYGTNGVGSWIISMSAGDYAQVYMGSGGNGSHSSTEYTYFNGYLLG